MKSHFAAFVFAIAVLISNHVFAQAVSPPPGQFVSIDGHKIYLMCQGAGSPTVILETGSGSSSKPFWPYLGQIASYTRVCTYDRAGFGLSDPVAQSRSIADRANELYTVLNKAGEKGPYILVGASYGGLIVRLVAKDHPKDVTGIVFLDAAEEGLALGPAASPYIDSVLSSMRQQLEKLRNATAPDVDAIARQQTLIDEGISLKTVPEAMQAPGGFGTLGNMPLAVITHGKPFTGDQASMEPSWRAGQERLVALSTRGKLLIAENSDHSILQHDSALFLQALRDVYQQARSKQD